MLTFSSTSKLCLDGALRRELGAGFLGTVSNLPRRVGASSIYIHMNLQDPEDALEVARSVVLGDDAKAAGIIYLEHEACTITSPSGRNWKIYGSPAAPEYAQGAFQYTTDDEAEGKLVFG